MSKDNKKDSKDLKEILPEITELTLNPSIKALVKSLPEHAQMIAAIEANLPEIRRSTSLFYKTQSQFMDNMLTVSHTTPLRNLRQILAEMNRSKEAINEFQFKARKQEIELKRKTRDLANAADELDKEMLEVEIAELQSNAQRSQGYLSGAIRLLANHNAQYNSIIETHGLQNFNEKDFEKEEEKYHIMKAFEQGMIAARSRGGLIDEGNMIYLTQIGINGAGAQREVLQYLKLEESMMRGQDGNGNNLVDKYGQEIGPVEPTHRMFLMFLESMAAKYAGSAAQYAAYKGMHGTLTEDATLLEGVKDIIVKRDGATWPEVLGVSTCDSLEHIEEEYRKLAKEKHPDAGGTEEQMAQLNWAIEAARGFKQSA